MPITYKRIATVEVGAGGTPNIEFTNIPTTYTDLLVKLSQRLASATQTQSVWVRYNNDTGNNYGNYSVVYFDNVGARTYLNLNNFTDKGVVAFTNFNSAPSGNFSNSEFYIPNYRGNHLKSIGSETVVENNNNTNYEFALGFIANFWNNTAPINSMLIEAVNGNFAQNTTAQLYGILKA